MVVCVDLSGPEVIDENLLVALTVSSGSGTANGKKKVYKTVVQ